MASAAAAGGGGRGGGDGESAASTSAAASVTTPQELADLFRKSGGFDQLRKSLMNQFLTSPEKDDLVKHLDELLPRKLSHSKPSRSKKDRHQDMLHEVEHRQMFLHNAVEGFGRGIKAREEDAEHDGKVGQIAGELDRALKRSRGEKIEDPMPEPVSATLAPPTPALPTPPHPPSSGSDSPLPNSAHTPSEHPPPASPLQPIPENVPPLDPPTTSVKEEDVTMDEVTFSQQVVEVKIEVVEKMEVGEPTSAAPLEMASEISETKNSTPKPPLSPTLSNKSLPISTPLPPSDIPTTLSSDSHETVIPTSDNSTTFPTSPSLPILESTPLPSSSSAPTIEIKPPLTTTDSMSQLDNQPASTTPEEVISTKRAPESETLSPSTTQPLREPSLPPTAEDSHLISSGNATTPPPGLPTSPTPAPPLDLLESTEPAPLPSSSTIALEEPSVTKKVEEVTASEDVTMDDIEAPISETVVVEESSVKVEVTQVVEPEVDVPETSLSVVEETATPLVSTSTSEEVKPEGQDDGGAADLLLLLAGMAESGGDALGSDAALGGEGKPALRVPLPSSLMSILGDDAEVKTPLEKEAYFM